MKSVICDLDGTLVDVRSIKHYIEQKPKDLDAFHRYSIGCPANFAVKLAIDSCKYEFSILIVTARQDQYRLNSVLWLNSNCIDYDELYMRKDGDDRPDYEVKSDILDQIITDGYEPIHAYDDNPNIIRLWTERGIETTFVEGFGFDSHE